MSKSEDGFLAEAGIFLIVVVVIAFFLSLFFVRFKASQSVVSGIVYNTEVNHLLSGNTTFSVRASENTYIYHDANGNTNESSFCLPPHSKYEALVLKAAANKTIKVDVTANKYFAIQAPWTCNPNVTVTEEK